MIVKGKNVIGLNVVTIEDGSVIETVDDIAYNPTTQRVEALLVSSGGLFGSAKAISMNDVHNIGEDAVIVHDASVIKSVESLDETVHSISDSNKYLVKTNVLTSEGKDLGTVSDLHFDSANGDVDSLEVTQGAFSGKRFVKPSDIVTIGKDATIVSTYTEEEFEQQTQETGVRGAINDAKDKINVTSQDLKEKAQNMGETFSDNSKQFAADVRERSADLADDVQVRSQQFAADAQDRASEIAAQTRVRTAELRENARDTAENIASETADRSVDAADRTQTFINDTKENNMSGLSDKLNGKAKQVAGDLSGDDKLKAEGKIEETKGDLKDKTNQALDTASDKLDDLKKKVQNR